MINLLPNETKQQIRAARTNSILIRYMIILGFAFTFLALACAATFLFLLNIEETNENGTKNTSQSSTNNQSTITKNILDQQVSYSELIMGIAAALPSGTILDSLSINDNALNAPMTLQIHARSTDDAAKLKDSFKPPLFSNTNINSTTNDSSGPTDYHVKVTVSVTINKGLAQ